MSSIEPLAEEFIQYVRETRGFSPETVRTYSYVLLRFIKEIEGQDFTVLTIHDIDQIINKFTAKRGLKASSANTVRCVLRSFFMYVDRYRGIRLSFDYSMIRQVKTSRPPISFVTVEKAKEIIERMNTVQDKLMVMTMFVTGMRIGELIRFTLEDFQEHEIIVRGKGGKTRVVPIDDMFSETLREYIYDHGISTGVIFRHQVPKSNSMDKPYTVSGVRNRWKRQLGPLGMYVKPHAFRHGIATNLLVSGMDIRTLQRFLGHSDIRTTMLYTHVTDKHLRDSYLENFKKLGFNPSEMI